MGTIVFLVLRLVFGYNELGDAQTIAPKMERCHIAGVGHHIRFAQPEAYREEFARYLARIYAGRAIAT